jgi:hypothetical protein
MRGTSVLRELRRIGGIQVKQSDFPVDERESAIVGVSLHVSKNTLNLDRRDLHQNRDISFYLFAAAALAGLCQLARPVAFGAEMVMIGSNLAEHAAFANPFSVGITGPTAVVPPVYPFLLAILFRVLKYPYLVFMGALICNILVNAWIAVLLPRVSFVFYADAMPGIFASVLWLLTARLMPSWDACYTLAGLLFFCLFSAKSIGRTDKTITFGVGAGVIGGLLFLSNPLTLLIFLPWIGYLLWREKPPVRRAIYYCCPLLITVLLFGGGWALRNKQQLGALVLRTNLGMTLAASNNDCAAPSMMENQRKGCYQAHHPNTSAAEAQLLVSLGEPEYDRHRKAEAISWIGANPGPFSKLTLRRVWQFWFPPREYTSLPAYLIWFATALSLPGLILMARRREAITLYMTGVLLIYPLMYYVVVTDVRYRYPLLWLSLLPAGYAMAAVLARLRRSGSTVRDYRSDRAGIRQEASPIA